MFYILMSYEWNPVICCCHILNRPTWNDICMMWVDERDIFTIHLQLKCMWLKLQWVSSEVLVKSKIKTSNAENNNK